MTIFVYIWYIYLWAPIHGTPPMIKLTFLLHVATRTYGATNPNFRCHTFITPYGHHSDFWCVHHSQLCGDWNSILSSIAFFHVHHLSFSVARYHLLAFTVCSSTMRNFANFQSFWWTRTSNLLVRALILCRELTTKPHPGPFLVKGDDGTVTIFVHIWYIPLWAPIHGKSLWQMHATHGMRVTIETSSRIDWEARIGERAWIRASQEASTEKESFYIMRGPCNPLSWTFVMALLVKETLPKKPGGGWKFEGMSSIDGNTIIWCVHKNTHDTDKENGSFCGNKGEFSAPWHTIVDLRTKATGLSQPKKKPKLLHRKKQSWVCFGNWDVADNYGKSKTGELVDISSDQSPEEGLDFTFSKTEWAH